jgi:hypothetical protein
MAKAGSISAVALFLLVLAVGSARAEDNCLAAPNARAPSGSHWRFHKDPIKKSKCWYLRTERKGTEEADVSGKLPKTRQLVPATQALASAQDGDWIGYQAKASSTAWPDSPHPTSAGNGVWPTP